LNRVINILDYIVYSTKLTETGTAKPFYHVPSFMLYEDHTFELSDP